MKRGLAFQASVDGISEVLRKPDGPTGEVVLLLGCAKNAAAAINGDIPGLSLSHIVCVASGKNTRLLEARCRTNPVIWQSFTMHDWLSPDDTIDIASDLARPLVAIEGAIHPQGPYPMAQRDGSSTLTRAVLVHCDMGHNRAPSLVLAYLVSCGLTLRDAYRQVFRVRPSVDPLPSYREGLRAFELARHGSSTVFGDDHFAMHISQLVQLVEQTGCTRLFSDEEDEKKEAGKEDKEKKREAPSSSSECSRSEDCSSEELEDTDSSGPQDEFCRVFDMAIEMRARSIKQLVEEVPTDAPEC